MLLPRIAVTWIDERFWPFLLYGMAALACVGTVLLVVHMSKQWHHITEHGQRLRYYALLGFGILITAGCSEQVQEYQADAFVLAYRHLGAVVCSLLLFTAAVWSLVDNYRRAR